MRAQVWMGELLLRLAGASWCLEWDGLERLEAARRASPRGNVIYAFFHNSLAILAYTHRARDIQVLVSQHRDGELIARILARMGHGLVRGSSRRGGVEALFRLAGRLDAGQDVAITVDGPVGPRYSVHSGVILLARRTGRPIVPVIPTASHDLRLRTWDALRLPWPGARVRLQHGEPVFVPESLPQSGVMAQQHRLQEQLRTWTRDEEARHGRAVELEDVQDLRGFWERASESPRPRHGVRALAAVYGAGARLVHATHSRPRPASSPPWVIGIGNLEAGGTGKTPCLLVLARALHDAGLEVAVLTRGHAGTLGRRRPELYETGKRQRASDETRLVAEVLGASMPILVSRDKRQGLEWLRRRGGLDVVLVDDALQTRALAVHRHLVLLDWEHPLGNGFLLPAGRLREPPSALRRADALLFTRARGIALPRHAAWDELLRDGRCFAGVEVCDALRTMQDLRVQPETLRGERVALISGVGRPQAFEAAARQLAARHGFEVRRAVRVGDHAPLEPALRKLIGKQDALGFEHVLTTRKDALRLPAASQWNEPLLVLEQRLEVGDLARLLQLLLPDYLSSAKLAKLTESEAGT